MRAGETRSNSGAENGPQPRKKESFRRKVSGGPRQESFSQI